MDVIVLQDDHWKKAYSPNILCSGGIGPCVAISIYDSKSKSGYMLHDPSPTLMKRISPFLKEVIEDYGSVSGLEVHVTGAAICDGEDFEEVLPLEREYTLKELYKVFKEDQVFVEWLPNNTIGELILYLKDGSYDSCIERLEGMV